MLCHFRAKSEIRKQNLRANTQYIFGQLVTTRWDVTEGISACRSIRGALPFRKRDPGPLEPKWIPRSTEPFPPAPPRQPSPHTLNLHKSMYKLSSKLKTNKPPSRGPSGRRRKMKSKQRERSKERVGRRHVRRCRRRRVCSRWVNMAAVTP